MNQRRLNNESCEPINGDFTDLEFSEPRITSSIISDFGVKTFPQFGAYGWYKLLYEKRCKVVAPINASRYGDKRPVVEVTKDATNVFVNN